MFEPLKHGDTIGIVAPASPVTGERIAHGVAWLEGCGYRVLIGDSIGKRDRFLAGSDRDRADDLVRMFADDSVKAVFTARGGYGSSRTLDLIDWSILKNHPKPFVGFSDTTALQMGMFTRAGIVSLTGFTLGSDAPEGSPPSDLQLDLERALCRGTFEPVGGLLHDEIAAGTLVGGCLSLLSHLVGTPYLPELAGCILLIEDVGESPYRIDRMLTQLLLSGILARAAGVALGTFCDCTGDSEDGSVDTVLADFKDRCPCPVIMGVPYGHDPTRRILPIGARVEVADGVMRFGAEVR